MTDILRQVEGCLVEHLTDSASKYSTVVKRELDVLWALISDIEWFAGIFEEVKFQRSGNSTARWPSSLDVRQQVGERSVSSSVVRKHFDDQNKEIAYLVGSSYFEFSLKKTNGNTTLFVDPRFTPTPSSRLVLAYANSLLQKLKERAEATM